MGKKTTALSTHDYEYIALKSSELASTKLMRMFGLISFALALLTGISVYAYFENKIDTLIAKEVASYLQTEAGNHVTETIRSNVAFVQDSLFTIDAELQRIDKDALKYEKKVEQIKGLLNKAPFQVTASELTFLNEDGSRVRIEWGNLKQKELPIKNFLGMQIGNRRELGIKFTEEYVSPPAVILAGGHHTPSGEGRSGYYINVESTNFTVKPYGRSELGREFYYAEEIKWLAIGSLKDNKPQHKSQKHQD